MLAALTTLEQAVGRSGRARESAPVRYAPPAGRFLAELAKDESPELRVAAGLASCQTLPGTGPSQLSARTMRQLLLPVDPGDQRAQPNGRWRDAPLVPGFGARPLPEVLADVLVWRCRTAADEPDAARFRGVPAFRSGVRVPAADLHAFARGALDDEEARPVVPGLPGAELAERPPPLVTGRAVDPGPHARPAAAAGGRPPARQGRGARRRQRRGEEPELALNPGLGGPARRRAGPGRCTTKPPPGCARPAGGGAGTAAVNPATGSRIAAALVPRCQNPRSVLPAIAIQIKTPDSEELS